MPWLLPALAGLAFLIAGAASAAEPNVESETWSSAYDGEFQKYTKRYFGPGFDWRWFKAQAIAESNLNPQAKSGVGAVGLMQIMPATYQEIRDQNPHFQDISTPRWNIAAGIFYVRYLFSHKAWQGMADDEKLLVAFAGYNAGLGGALRAYRRAVPQPAETWESVEQYAPAETRGYVRRIERLKRGEDRKRRNPMLKGFAARYRRSR